MKTGNTSGALPSRGARACVTCWSLALVLFGCCACGVTAAEVLVAMPQVREPYRSVLNQIVDGIEQTASARLVVIDDSSSDPAQAPAPRDERVVIALGRSAIEAAAALRNRIPLTVGAVLTPLGRPPLPGISLEAEPEALFRRLHRLRPAIRKVHWLYRPARNGWLLEHADRAARANGLELLAVPAEDARSAAQRYQEILEHADSASEAVWLTQDPALLSVDSALPDILDRAWSNHIVIFSGSVQHVAHGVLFALFPDNVAMGSELARLALDAAAGKTVTFRPNRRLRSAINRRTAEHLGIVVDAGDFDLVLPAR
ncbi:MAG: hypothetical protein Kow0073_10930 [Immundisolibacter sp.]